MTEPAPQPKPGPTPFQFRLLAMHDEIDAALDGPCAPTTIEDRGRLELLRHALADVIGNRVSL